MGVTIDIDGQEAMHKIIKSKLVKILVVIVFIYFGLRLFEVVTSVDNNKIDTKTVNQLCNRNESYPMPSEFERALSLIKQRLIQANAQDKSKYSYPQVLYAMYNPVFNCLNIQYANSKSDIQGAEGIFYFVPESTKDNLNILVSPEYESKDDILTAILISHELHHAWAYASNKYSNADSREACYQNEIDAFYTETVFFLTLNEEERESVFSRAEIAKFRNQSNESKAYQVVELLMGNFSKNISQLEDIKRNINNYVRNSIYYQRQCDNI